jgi:hypothetical protein
VDLIVDLDRLAENADHLGATSRDTVHGITPKTRISPKWTFVPFEGSYVVYGDYEMDTRSVDMPEKVMRTYGMMVNLTPVE